MKEPSSPSHSRQSKERPCLEVEGVAFLDNGPYSFSVESGECVGLAGVSGVGKTQLLRALVDLIPHAGSVRWDGVKMSDIAAPQWRSRICMVPTDSIWWYDLVAPHLPEKVDREYLHHTLQQVGFQPDVMNWQVSRLSTGERQRLALVRAIALQPQVLLLDEPSSGLDVSHTLQVERLILEYRLSRPAAIVWVSHDSDQLDRVAGYSLVVEKKRLVKV